MWLGLKIKSAKNSERIVLLNQFESSNLEQKGECPSRLIKNMHLFWLTNISRTNKLQFKMRKL